MQLQQEVWIQKANLGGKANIFYCADDICQFFSVLTWHNASALLTAIRKEAANCF